MDCKQLFEWNYTKTFKHVTRPTKIIKKFNPPHMLVAKSCVYIHFSYVHCRYSSVEITRQFIFSIFSAICTISNILACFSVVHNYWNIKAPLTLNSLVFKHMHRVNKRAIVLNLWIYFVINRQPPATDVLLNSIHIL